jgi:hypothetical protein
LVVRSAAQAGQFDTAFGFLDGIRQTPFGSSDYDN